MNRIARKIGRAALVFAVVVALLVYVPWSYMAGSVLAGVDVVRGRPKILVYGLPVPWRDEGAAILHDRYGVEIEPIGGCRISSFIVRFAKGYNAVSKASIRARAGRDVIGASFDEARVDWERAHPLSER